MVWQFSCWQQVLRDPAVSSLNIGFGVDATTLDERSLLDAGSLSFPLRVAVMQADRLRDQDTFRRLFSNIELIGCVGRKVLLAAGGPDARYSVSTTTASKAQRGPSACRLTGSVSTAPCA